MCKVGACLTVLDACLLEALFYFSNICKQEFSQLPVTEQDTIPENLILGT